MNRIIGIHEQMRREETRYLTVYKWSTEEEEGKQHPRLGEKGSTRTEII
jgi:hypothetical protein